MNVGNALRFSFRLMELAMLSTNISRFMLRPYSGISPISASYDKMSKQRARRHTLTFACSLPTESPRIRFVAYIWLILRSILQRIYVRWSTHPPSTNVGDYFDVGDNCREHYKLFAFFLHPTSFLAADKLATVAITAGIARTHAIEVK